MDWLNELRELRPQKGIDRVVIEMMEKLIGGPVSFPSPYWDGDIVIATVDDYLAWARASERIQDESRAEQKAIEIWRIERRQPAPSVSKE